MTPEKRPLLLGLAASAVALAIRLRWPPTPKTDVAWALLLIVVAASLVWFERRMARTGRPIPLIRWVAGGLAFVALLQLGWLLVRAA